MRQSLKSARGQSQCTDQAEASTGASRKHCGSQQHHSEAVWEGRSYLSGIHFDMVLALVAAVCLGADGGQHRRPEHR